VKHIRNSGVVRSATCSIALIALLAAGGSVAQASHHRHHSGSGGAHIAGTAAGRKQARVQLRGKLSSVRQRLQSVRSQLHAAKHSEEEIAAELTAVRQELAGTRQRLSAAKAHLTAARAEQAKVQVALLDSEHRLQTRELLLSTRMAANYRQGPVRYASVLLGARSMGEMVTRATFVRSIVQYDARLIDQIKQGRQEVLRWKADVDQKTADVASDEQELGARQDDESADVERERDVLIEARQRRAEFEQQLDALQADSDEIAARLRALQETPVGHARQMIAFTGGFIHPCDAPITSGFGMRYHPILHYMRLHAGIDFGAPTGTPIQAAAAGIVVFSGVMHGYGNVVVIDHGGGISTLYAHCSERDVEEGQPVAQGQVIARVGMTGLATGPHLHFEVRKNGTPIDPMGVL
jgi:murein DD-endopeptidase MepM/ murein hydrolase activator NlpD